MKVVFNNNKAFVGFYILTDFAFNFTAITFLIKFYRYFASHYVLVSEISALNLLAIEGHFTLKKVAEVI